jgi:hypothetical protein
MRALIVVGVCGVVIVACNKSNDAAGADAVATSTLTNVKYQTDKLPPRGTKPIVQHATRGGTGDTAPNATSRRADEEDTDRQSRTLAHLDNVDCAKLPDNVGECDGNKFFFCDDQQLWVTDCNAEAKLGGAVDGSCFEGEKLVDCLGCGQATDGTRVCCDFSQTICCDAVGACWTPK